MYSTGYQVYENKYRSTTGGSKQHRTAASSTGRQQAAQAAASRNRINIMTSTSDKSIHRTSKFIPKLSFCYIFDASVLSTLHNISNTRTSQQGQTRFRGHSYTVTSIVGPNRTNLTHPHKHACICYLPGTATCKYYVFMEKLGCCTIHW